MIVYLALPMISTIVCSAFACERFFDPSQPREAQFQKFLKVDMSIRCERNGVQTEVYAAIRVYSLFMIFAL